MKPGGGGSFTVYATWNGATKVKRWRVLAGASKSTLKRVAAAPRRGFETPIKFHTKERYVVVEALSGSGGVLGRTRMVPSKAGCTGPEC